MNYAALSAAHIYVNSSPKHIKYREIPIKIRERYAESIYTFAQTADRVHLHIQTQSASNIERYLFKFASVKRSPFTHSRRRSSSSHLNSKPSSNAYSDSQALSAAHLHIQTQSVSTTETCLVRVTSANRNSSIHSCRRRVHLHIQNQLSRDV